MAGEAQFGRGERGSSRRSLDIKDHLRAEPYNQVQIQAEMLEFFTDAEDEQKNPIYQGFSECAHYLIEQLQIPLNDDKDKFDSVKLMLTPNRYPFAKGKNAGVVVDHMTKPSSELLEYAYDLVGSPAYVRNDSRDGELSGCRLSVGSYQGRAVYLVENFKDKDGTVQLEWVLVNRALAQHFFTVLGTNERAQLARQLYEQSIIEIPEVPPEVNRANKVFYIAGCIGLKDIPVKEMPLLPPGGES